MFKGDAAELDRTVRLYVYGQFLEYGRPPEIERIAGALHTTSADVRESFQRLAESHALVLSRDGNAVRMAMPFSAEATSFQVSAVGRNHVQYHRSAGDSKGLARLRKRNHLFDQIFLFSLHHYVYRVDRRRQNHRHSDLSIYRGLFGYRTLLLGSCHHGLVSFAKD